MYPVVVELWYGPRSRYCRPCRNSVVVLLKSLVGKNLCNVGGYVTFEISATKVMGRSSVRLVSQLRVV